MIRNRRLQIQHLTESEILYECLNTVQYLNLYVSVVNQDTSLCAAARSIETNSPSEIETLCEYLNTVQYLNLYVTVVNQDTSMCAAARGIETNAPSGYISSLHAGIETGGIGLPGGVVGGVASRSCPLHIYAHPGQYINLTLYNFGQYYDLGRDKCPYYAIVEEGQHTKNISLCKAGYRRSHLYKSSHSSISFFFGGKNVGASRYLVKYTG